MRRGCVLAVSSALLFLSIVSAPCHASSSSGRADAQPGILPAPVLISEFYPCGLLGDEYVRLRSTSQTPVNLLNWSLTDGEGTLRVCQDLWLDPLGSLTVSMNSSSYFSAYGIYPEISLDVQSAQQSISLRGAWRLSDAGDSLALLCPNGLLADFAVYGNCSESSHGWSGPPIPTLKKGEVAKRISVGSLMQDTDSQADWLPFREFKYGYTEFGPCEAAVAPGALTAFVSPDCSLETVVNVLDSARSTIRLCAYEFDSASVCTSLLRAASKGVSVRVFLDGAPAGGLGEREEACASVLAAGGVSVSMLNGNLSQKIVRHVGPLHAKYAVVDSMDSIVLSENFVESGLPVDKICGNRGWGVLVEDSKVAQYLERLFDSDSRSTRSDVLDWRASGHFDPNADLPEIPEADHTRGMLNPFHSTRESRVRLVPSPDGSLVAPFACSMLSDASSIQTEQFQVDLFWATRWTDSSCLDPLLESLEIAMARGASVEMLFDSSWFNSEKNSAAVSYLASDALNRSWNGQFKLLDTSSPVTVLHNKGAIIDGKLVMISSNNWGYSSFAKNRELAILLESDEIASYFSRAFSFDWIPDDVSPNAYAGEDLTVGLGEQVRLDAAGSTDDRVIAHWAWDIDGDGEAEATGEQVKFFVTRPGRIVVSLTVEDAWGNRGYDTVTVEILPSSSPSPFGGSSGERLGVLVSVIGASGGLMVGALFARRQLRSSRNFNHPRRD